MNSTTAPAPTAAVVAEPSTAFAAAPPAPGHGRYRTHETRNRGRWEGRDTGGIVSGFVVDGDPGDRPGLHVHPYPETFLVLSGTAVFTAGEERIHARAGDVVTVPAGTPHEFVIGEGGAQLVGIHGGAEIEQRFL